MASLPSCSAVLAKVDNRKVPKSLKAALPVTRPSPSLIIPSASTLSTIPVIACAACSALAFTCTPYWRQAKEDFFKLLCVVLALSSPYIKASSAEGSKVGSISPPPVLVPGPPLKVNIPVTLSHIFLSGSTILSIPACRPSSVTSSIFSLGLKAFSKASL